MAGHEPYYLRVICDLPAPRHSAGLSDHDAASSTPELFSPDTPTQPTLPDTHAVVYVIYPAEETNIFLRPAMRCDLTMGCVYCTRPRLIPTYLEMHSANSAQSLLAAAIPQIILPLLNYAVPACYARACRVAVARNQAALVPVVVVSYSKPPQ
jgi:hypothetical protein